MCLRARQGASADPPAARAPGNGTGAQGSFRRRVPAAAQTSRLSGASVQLSHLPRAPHGICAGKRFLRQLALRTVFQMSVTRVVEAKCVFMTLTFKDPSDNTVGCLGSFEAPDLLCVHTRGVSQEKDGQISSAIVSSVQSKITQVRRPRAPSLPPAQRGSVCAHPTRRWAPDPSGSRGPHSQSVPQAHTGSHQDPHVSPRAGPHGQSEGDAGSFQEHADQRVLRRRAAES